MLFFPLERGEGQGGEEDGETGVTEKRPVGIMTGPVGIYNT